MGLLDNNPYALGQFIASKPMQKYYEEERARKLAEQQQQQYQQAIPQIYGNANTAPSKYGNVMGLTTNRLGEQVSKPIYNNGSGLIGAAQSPQEQAQLQAQKLYAMNGGGLGVGLQQELAKNYQNNVMQTLGKIQQDKANPSSSQKWVGSHVKLANGNIGLVGQNGSVHDTKTPFYEQKIQVVNDVPYISKPSAGTLTPPTINNKPLTTNEVAMQKAEQARQVKEAQVIGQANADSQVKKDEITRQLPRLTEVVKDLYTLSDKATYTWAGQGRDAVLRQFDLPMSDAGKARSAFTSNVNNIVLPLLKQTFGAAFTAAEGERLVATLGDPDASPEEKKETLTSFINQKLAEAGRTERFGTNGKLINKSGGKSFDDLWEQAK